MNPHFDMNEMTDDQIIKEFKVGDHWSLSIGIDLERCNMDKISDPDMIEQFIIGLCDYIGTKQYGNLKLIKFDSNPKLAGHSLSQFIDTSSITARFKEFDGNVYIDISSCKGYPPRATSMFCKKFFNAQRVITRYIAYRD